MTNSTIYILEEGQGDGDPLHIAVNDDLDGFAYCFSRNIGNSVLLHSNTILSDQVTEDQVQGILSFFLYSDPNYQEQIETAILPFSIRKTGQPVSRAIDTDLNVGEKTIQKITIDMTPLDTLISTLYVTQEIDPISARLLTVGEDGRIQINGYGATWPIDQAEGLYCAEWSTPPIQDTSEMYLWNPENNVLILIDWEKEQVSSYYDVKTTVYDDAEIVSLMK